MSTPMSSKGKACCVSGCTEPRMQRNYCARHHNASLGKSERPVRPGDLEPAVTWLLEGMTRGVDAIHASLSPAVGGGSTAGGSGSMTNAPSLAPRISPYLAMLTPLAEKLLDNIKNPNSSLPVQGGALDIFSFSSLGPASAPSVSPAKGATPPRPPPTARVPSEEGEGAAPPSPADTPSAVAAAAAAGNSSATFVSNPLAPIVDIRVQLSKQRKKVPVGFDLLERSISGKYDADINKSGNGKSVMLCFQRAETSEEKANIAANQRTASSNASSVNSKKDAGATASSSSSGGSGGNNNAQQHTPAALKPITSLSVIFRDACEEPPYGFQMIDKTTMGLDANLNHHSSSNTAGRQVYLCVHRGEGAPIIDLGVIFHEKKETLPPGFHAVKHTPFGNRADLNAQLNAQPAEAQHAVGAAALQAQAEQAVFLCFRPHVTPVLQTYISLLADPSGTSDSASRGFLLHAQTLALLTALLYSYDQKMVLHALEGFMKIPIEGIPALLLNRFLQCVCDAAPAFQTYFTTQAHSSLLKFLLHAFRSFHAQLSIDTLSKVLEVCFLTRHEDKQGEVSEKIVSEILGRIERVKPCMCQVQETKERQMINMNAVAGGEGHSKPRSHHKQHGNNNASSGGSGGNNPAASPASSAGGASGGGGVGGDSSPSSHQPPVAVSSIPCSQCQWNRAFARASPSVFCRELSLQLAQQVLTAKEIESDVKTFQRHTNTGVSFRTDIAKLTTTLFNIDQAHAAHIQKATEAAAAAAEHQQPLSPGRGPPPLPRQLSGLVNGIASLVMGSSSSSSVSSDNGASPNSAASPTSASSSTSSASNGTGGGGGAFDDVLVGGGAGSRGRVADKDRIWLPQKEERLLCVAALVCAKFASESITFGLSKSELLKRKAHALRLLFYILHHGVYYFRSCPSGRLLIRRFIVPALMSVCVTDSSLLWRLLLQTFTVLYEQYRSFLLLELGVWFDHILLSLLESPLVACDLKRDILDMWAHILGRTPEHLIHLFYCYDNSHKNWNIFERLNTNLARISEGEQKSQAPLHLSDAAGAKTPGGTSGAASAAAAAPDQRAELIAQQEEALQRQALKLLVHNLHMMAQWAGVPGLKRSPDIPSQPLLTEDEQGDEPDAAAGAEAVAGGGDSSSSAAAGGGANTAAARMSRVHRASRIDTWSWRHDKQKADAKVLAESLKLARNDKLKSALQYLRIVDPANANPKNVAHFLFSHDGLDKAEVGDFLGSCGDKFMDDQEHEALRHAYLEHLDFTGLLFDQGLRLFLCDSGFRLPGEAQKIDRLLEAFCKAYCRDNPSIFRNANSAFVVSFALVMLNTDLHDARLKAGTMSRQPMTENQFISNLRGVDAGMDFPRPFLETLYRNIAAQAIEWKEKKTDGAMAAAEERAREMQTDSERQEDHSKAVRKTYELALRRALAYLKNWAAHEAGYQRTSNTLIVAAMFEVSWYRTVSAITLRSDNYVVGDVELLHVCLEGLAYGSSIAIALGLSTERFAFSRQLAKLTFIERNRDSNKSGNMKLRLANGEHLKQEWYRPFNLMCEKTPARACRLVFECASDIKAKINYERRQARLRSIESDFAHEICLVDPARSFVREGQLMKWANSSATKKTLYSFLLFSDLLLYASEGINSKWKCHRVIHLSLCRLEDLQGIQYADQHAFRIISPQKSFVVSAPSKEKKQAWLQAILHHLELVMAKRRKYLQLAAGGGIQSSPLSPSEGSGSGGGSVMEGNEEIMRRLSTFIGQSDFDLNQFTRANSGANVLSAAGEGNAASGASSSVPAAPKQSTHCKLCIRPWAIFRRRQKCRWCCDSVCNDCVTQKCILPNGAKRLVNVCDACYGVLKGMCGPNVPLITTADV